MDRHGKDAQGSQRLPFGEDADAGPGGRRGLLETVLDGREAPSPEGEPAPDAERTFAVDAARRYRDERVAHWDAVAASSAGRRGLGSAYHRRLERVYGALVPPGRRVLEIGCGEGNLLAALHPSLGVGVDFSAESLQRAIVRHPHLHFVHGDAHDLSEIHGEFDAIVLSDLVNDVWDVEGVLQQVSRLTHRQTRVIINSYSHLWELPLSLAGRLWLSKPNLPQNWLSVDDIVNLLSLTGFVVVRHWREVLWPVPTLLIEPLCNRVLVKLWPLNHLALTSFVVARFPARRRRGEPEPLVSVVVPACNEAGNVADVFARTPEMGSGVARCCVRAGRGRAMP